VVTRSVAAHQVADVAKCPALLRRGATLCKSQPGV
jgi:hypothetical protein